MAGEHAERRVDVVVVGAGFAGLRVLHRLRGDGYRLVVLEAGADIGGVWHWNRYPGARCDVESADYSYSFSPELDQDWTWSQRYADQPEILRYIHHVAERFDLRRDIRTDTRVTGADFDESTDTWTVHSERGRWRARWLIMATGCLSVPRRPEIPGVDAFAGPVLYTAQWPHRDPELAGKRVAVIGTGSSGIQTIPVLAERAAHLTVFQRTPNFSVPAANRALSDADQAEIKAAYPSRRESLRNSPSGMSVPVYKESALEATPQQRRARYEHQWDRVGFGFVLSYADLLFDERANDTAAQFIRDKIHEKVRDPDVAEALSPRDYPFGAKRPCVDSGYFETFNRDDVELVDVRSDPIQAVTTAGVRTASAHHDADVLVFATGFDAMTGALLRMDLQGRDGVTLQERWSDGPVSYLGLAVAGLPNMFVVAGPGSPSLLTNVIVSIEQHADWIAELLAHAASSGVSRIEADPQAEREWTEHVAETAAATLYPRADTYYVSDTPSRMFMPYTGGVRGYRRICDRVAADGYSGFVLTCTDALEGAR